MYVKRIQLLNYGPISRLDIEFPFDADKPKPVILVGENGSGKSVLLSHIVNGLLIAQQRAYPQNPEVDVGMVYKIRAPGYVQSGKEASFSEVSFEDDLYIRELLLRQRKRAYGSIPRDVAEVDAQEAWEEISPINSGVALSNFDKKKATIENIFLTRCALYFPPNRFEEPAWLNERNLKAKAQNMNRMHLEGHTDRRIINHASLHDNVKWLFDVAYDVAVCERQTYQEDIPSNLFDIAEQIAQIIMPQVKEARLRIGERSDRAVSITENGKRYVPNIFQLSSGEVTLLNLFLSILRDYDLCGAPFNKPEDIRGIVIVDEIDLHLHAKHQYEILPELIKIFPRIQFVVTTHSPLFLLGLRKAFGEDDFVLYNLPQGEPVDPEEFREFGEAYRAFSDTHQHSNDVSDAIRNSQNPIVFVDGPTDVTYLRCAAKLLGREKTIENIEIQGGKGSANLRKVWSNLTGVNVKHLNVEHQPVILFHDCDDKVEPDERGKVFRWTIPQIESHPIRNGIENRFSRETLEKAKKYKPAFIDIEKEHPVVRRGVDKTIPEKWEVNNSEKTNLCDWLCEEGEAEDFEHFREILDKLGEVLSRFQSTSDQD